MSIVTAALIRVSGLLVCAYRGLGYCFLFGKVGDDYYWLSSRIKEWQVRHNGMHRLFDSVVHAFKFSELN